MTGRGDSLLEAYDGAGLSSSLNPCPGRLT
jgi:hypothetical protein